ncbi:hypothetical protein H5410_001711 [Solanum commersonii]|uniref:Uncharacterized protein n=1 Tax=Solanum commersonii TaxID=4109 RepID=A0A9J6B0C4_SOLCO|nr:hypothetical protein H5410_001711 [Solanum commersonii]
MTLALSLMLPYLLVVSFLALISILALRNMIIMKYMLTYLCGTTTAYMINCFHTLKGAKLAKEISWFLVQIIFARDEGCGFANLHTFCSQAYAKRFYFDFSSTYVGVGMICLYMVNMSLLMGAIVSWAFM